MPKHIPEPEKPFHEMMDEPLSQGVSKCSTPDCANTAYVRLSDDEKFCPNCYLGLDDLRKRTPSS